MKSLKAEFKELLRNHDFRSISTHEIVLICFNRVCIEKIHAHSSEIKVIESWAFMFYFTKLDYVKIL